MLALTQAGVSREDSYRLVQSNAMKVWESNGQKSFLDLLKADAEIAKHMKPDQLAAIFDYGYYTKHSADILKRAFAA
jgi:adenylosuccinate lyase